MIFINENKINSPWPKTIEHVIDSESPLYDICNRKYERSMKQSESNKNESKNLNNDRIYESNEYDYEIVVILEGNFFSLISEYRKPSNAAILRL